MKRTGKVAAVWGLGAAAVCAVIVGASASSAGGPRENGPSSLNELTAAVESLRKEVRSLRSDVDYLLRKESYTPEEIGYLEEIVAASEATHEKALALSKLTVSGGEAEKVAAAALRLALTQARLARAHGQREEFEQAYEAAMAAAQREVKAYQAAFDANTVTIDVLLRAKARRAEAQLELIRLRREFAKMPTK